MISVRDMSNLTISTGISAKYFNDEYPLPNSSCAVKKPKSRRHDKFSVALL